MAFFVVKDPFEKARTRHISHPRKPFDRRGGDIECTRFEHHRHDGKSRGRIVAGLKRCVPQPIVRGKRAIAAAQGAQAAFTRREMHRFISGNSQEISRQLPAQLSTEAPGRLDRPDD